MIGQIRADTNYKVPGTWLHFGGYEQGNDFYPGVKFQIHSVDISGEYFFIQTGHATSTLSSSNGTNYVGFGTGVDNGINTNDFIYPFDAGLGDYATGDSPATALLSNYTNVTVNDSFSMYLMYQYAPSTVMVPLRKIDWNWSATAILTNSSLNAWQLISSNAPSGLLVNDTFSYPVWTNHMQPINWTPPLP